MIDIYSTVYDLENSMHGIINDSIHKFKVKHGLLLKLYKSTADNYNIL